MGSLPNSQRPSLWIFIHIENWEEFALLVGTYPGQRNLEWSMALYSWDLLLWDLYFQWWFCEHGRIISAQGKPNHPFKKRHLFCFLTLTRKSRVQIFIILSDTTFLLSSPDQMVGVVLLNRVSTVSPVCCYLIFQTWVPSWPAGSFLRGGWTNGKHAGQGLGRFKCDSLLLFSVFWVSVNFFFKVLIWVQTQGKMECYPGRLLFMFHCGKYSLPKHLLQLPTLCYFIIPLLWGVSLLSACIH